MTTEEASSDRVAKRLNMSPIQVEQILASLNGTIDTTVLRHKLADQIEMFLAERTQKFRSIKPEDLRYNQGIADGLELAIKTIIPNHETIP